MRLKGRTGRIKDHALIPGNSFQMRLGPGLIPQQTERRKKELAWKKRFAPSVRMSELVGNKLRIESEPESLGKGRYRVRAALKGGGEIQFTTFEGTIGNIIGAQGAKGYAEAYFSKDKNEKGQPYVNWRPAKA